MEPNADKLYFDSAGISQNSLLIRTPKVDWCVGLPRLHWYSKNNTQAGSGFNRYTGSLWLCFFSRNGILKDNLRAESAGKVVLDRILN